MTKQFRPFLLPAFLVGAASIFAVGCSKQVDSTPVSSATAPLNSMSPPPPVAPSSATTVGTAIDDTVVTASVKSALLGDPDIKSFDFKVETRKGEVMLSGFVDSQAQVDRADALAKAVAGVTSVQNKVTLKSGTATVGNKVDDSIITTKVKAALIGDEVIKSNDIAVVTRKGEVQLSGFVNSQTQIDRALLITKAVEGVSNVSNEMSIKK
jgi:hyperosmotically inducible periplasmic protein